MITVSEDFKLVGSDGYILGNEVCAGDKFTVAKGADKGEWWQDGGYADSPPIFWVDDVEAVVDKIMGYHEAHLTTSSEIRSFREDPVQGWVDGFSGIPIYTVPIALPSVSWLTTMSGSVVCSLNKPGGGKAEYAYDQKGTVDLNETYSVECMYYYYGARGGYAEYGSPEPKTYYTFKVPTVLFANPYGSHYSYTDIMSKSDLFKVGEIGIKKTLNILDPVKPKVEVSVAGADNIKYGESNILRVLVKNVGDVNISLKSLNSRPVGKTLSCDSVVLSPGKIGECLLSVVPLSGGGLSVQVSYDYKSCGRSQIGLETKVLIASKVLEPVLSEQSYSLGVHGGCENSYYACNEAKTQPSLFAGYKCYKTSNGFFTPTTESFVLKFDLSSLPRGLDISGARLNLYSNTVGKLQKVDVYSVDRDWKALQCVPGGDICARPYCSECAPVYDLGGVLQSGQQVNSADRYSFDVSALIKDKYSKGDSSVSFQVRGVEGLWESMGQSGCSVENNWENLDVSFDSASGNAPYLEMVYKE